MSYSGLILLLLLSSTQGLRSIRSPSTRFVDGLLKESSRSYNFDDIHDVNNFIDATGDSIAIVPATPAVVCQDTDIPIIVGIAGGSGSGKTTLTRKIMETLGSEHVSYISHDSYYKDLQHLPIEQRASTNFDHPNSLDTELLREHISLIKRGFNVDIPVYDFSTHSRVAVSQRIHYKPICIVDGILIFSDNELSKLFDMKIYVECEDDIRLIRRIKRDGTERGRSVDSVLEQYQKTVRPMHHLFVEPSKRTADIIIPNSNGVTDIAVASIVSRLREYLNFCQ